MDAFKGKFERISAENYEEILKVRFCTYKHLLDFYPSIPVSGTGGELPAAEGGHRLHPEPGHHGERGRVVHQVIHHPQNCGAQVQGDQCRKHHFSALV